MNTLERGIVSSRLMYACLLFYKPFAYWKHVLKYLANGKQKWFDGYSETSIHNVKNKLEIIISAPNGLILCVSRVTTESYPVKEQTSKHCITASSNPVYIFKTNRINVKIVRISFLDIFCFCHDSSTVSCIWFCYDNFFCEYLDKNKIKSPSNLYPWDKIASEMGPYIMYRHSKPLYLASIRCISCWRSPHKSVLRLLPSTRNAT